ncbi:MAG TPA: copper-binding protein [Burkholderiaceae bacterium]|nr:copper-binding protein [Burkholderiaceae bacterium]
MQTIRNLATALVLAAIAAGAAAQISGKDNTGKTGAEKTTPSAIGEVRKVDKDAGKITLKHGPIKADNLEMDPMTMVFQVRDKSLLDGIKAGDKVRFRVVSEEGGRMTVTEIKAAP